MADFTLTTGSDNVTGTTANDTVYATAATLNVGDSLTGGTGTDVLALVGSGSFSIDQLATFTGFERIKLDNATSSNATLTLSNQPIEVDATGGLSIFVNSLSNWNGSNIINGDASHTWNTTSLNFQNQSWDYVQGVYLPIIYDLTSNTLSHVNIYDAGNNVTFLINNAVTAGVQSFSSFAQNAKLATAGSTLDLSHTTVAGLSVTSTNALGTAFTVGDLGTAFQIAGGSGQDTIVATGFTFSADQRNSIFATASIEKIIDSSGTYAAPPPPPGVVGLTAGVDTIVGSAADDTVYATAATLNVGDSLTGGAGTDVLALVGSGSFSIDQLATFTGFERIKLDNATSSNATLTLSNQPIEVDATGGLSIFVNSLSNWNGSNIINGDASHTWNTTSLNFQNQSWDYVQGVYLPIIYDLTSNTLSHVNIYDAGNNVTFLINNAVTAGVQSFSSFAQNAKLATAGSTLDLSHTTVAGLSVTSTNALGTAFTVGDLGTAFQIAGGSGQDTIVATGFTFSADQRNSIFATASIEKIIDSSGTYAAPPPPPGVVGLTAGVDTIVGSAADDTVYATAATLNVGDSLTGGAGTDVLALVGSGSFSIDQLATFTGFERIKLDNATSSNATLTLSNQPIEVDATGGLSIFVNSLSNWNGSNIINGDASHTWNTTSLNFQNQSWDYVQGVYLPIIYDLTSNTLSHVNIYDAGNNVTFLINNAVTAGVQSFSSFAQNAKLATAGSTLDLSHTTVAGLSVTSTNALGTAFTVGDLGTAFQIAGGSGQDTIVATGFTFSADQRNSIFATASIEKIIDSSGTYAVVNAPPTITSNGGGNMAAVSIAENTTVVTTVTASDPDAGQTLSYSIIGGVDASKFTIGSTGVLSFVTAPNFDLPTDAGGNNVYDVVVKASDGHGGSDTQALAVTVQNVVGAIIDTYIPLNMLNGFNFSNLLYADNYSGNSGFFTAGHLNGTNDTLWGYGFTYDTHGVPTGSGTVTGYSLFGNWSADLLVDISGISIPTSWIRDAALTPSTADDIAIVRTALAGADTVYGSDYSDVLDGFNGNDTIYGYAGNDVLFGDAGNDVLFGGADNDILNGGIGADTLTGGNGNDAFVYAPGSGADVVTDFVAGAGIVDRVALTAFGGIHNLNDVLSFATQVGADTVFNFGGGDTLTLQNVAKSSLAADDFAFAPLTRDDFDGNAHDDINWVNDNGMASVWDNGQISGAHLIAPAGTISNGWHFAGAGDFDGNGHSDIAWVNDNGMASIWDNGQIGGAHLIAPAGTIANGWHFAGTGDFDGNGHSDITWVNDNGMASIWDNGQIGSAHLIAPAGTIANGWHFAGAGDFDGNGHSDIAWVNDNGMASIWDNGQIGGAHLIAPAGTIANGWHFAGTGDFDGNGQSDILWRNDSGAASVWDNGQIGDAHIVANPGSVPGSWHVADVGDYDGNGHSDILWHNDNGAASIWDNGQINGAHIIANPGAIPNDWHIV